MQRRINAKEASLAQAKEPSKAEMQTGEPERISTPAPAEPPLSKDSYYSIIDSDELPPDSCLETSSSAGDLDSQSGESAQTPQPPDLQPVGLTDAELIKLAGLTSVVQQAQHAQQLAGSQPAPGAGNGSVNIVAKADSQKTAAAASAEGKQRRKSKREKARGLLSSFTTSRKQVGAQEDMDQALQMLAELRRTESTPNVEAEALKRNKGGGGPWMSFTRQRRPAKPRSAKQRDGSPGGARRGSPLSTVISGKCRSSTGRNNETCTKHLKPAQLMFDTGFEPVNIAYCSCFACCLWSSSCASACLPNCHCID